MSTARITADQLNSPQLQGQSVRAVGKLMQMDAQQGSVQLELPGAQPTNVTVSCPSGTDKFLLESVGKGYYEVVGTLNAGNSIQEMQTVFMGENLDTGMYVEMVKLTQQFPDIF